MTKEDKYGDDSIYESWSDNYIFNPIGAKLVYPLRCLGFNPNKVTFLSLIFSLLASYFLYIDKKIYSIIFYLIGYILDCTDGKMARRYNETTKFGIIFDLATDKITNGILFLILLKKLGISSYIFILFVFSYMLGIAYGLNEAISVKSKTGDDNFSKYNHDLLKEMKNPLKYIYLLVTDMSYSTYRRFFPKYDKKRINKWLCYLKHFGPGNFNVLVSLIIYFYL